MKPHWVTGNQVELLENGEAFFPAVFNAIAGARREVVLETFILFEDKVGIALKEVLVAAAQRGVQVDVMVDGFGSPDLSDAYIGALTHAGVRLRVFDPGQRYFGQRLNIIRRMHRKIVVVDGQRAFVGGINYSADHLADFGPEAKQDYSLAIEGPIVSTIHHFALRAIAVGDKRRAGIGGSAVDCSASHPGRRPSSTSSETTVHANPTGNADALFVTRDNHRHRNDIECQYMRAINGARQRLVIANAYFFPGYRMIKALRHAARRGVDVRLILQGQPDMPIVKIAASMLYHHLLNAGVRIYEYYERPLHGKVAIADTQWATVGSSNLDPLSLSLNLEANVFIHHEAFNAHLYRRLDHLMQNSCRQVHADELGEWSGWRLVRSFFVFHFMRWYPYLANWLPRHEPRLMPVTRRADLGGSAGETRTDAA